MRGARLSNHSVLPATTSSPEGLISPVALLEVILLLLTAAMAADRIANRLRLPPAVAHVLVGVALALAPAFPTITLNPDLALVLFLPPLLMHSALQTDWQEFRRALRFIFNLAFGAVLFSTIVVGLVAHLVVPSLPWAACFALTAIVSPPDAVAAKALLRHGRFPHRLVTVLEGESLVNDATALVLYRFAVAAAVNGSFHAGAATLQFAAVAAGGLGLGAVLGLCARDFCSPGSTRQIGRSSAVFWSLGALTLAPRLSTSPACWRPSVAASS